MTTDAELDRMYETAVAQDWEEQNAVDRTGWNDAISLIEKAIESLQEAKNFLLDAAESVAYCGETDRISSLADEVSYLCNDADTQKGRMKQ